MNPSMAVAAFAFLATIGLIKLFLMDREDKQNNEP
jgi:hypothetical protein